MSHSTYTQSKKKIFSFLSALVLLYFVGYTPLSYAAYPLGDEVIFYNFEDTGATTNNLGSSGDTNDGTFVGGAATTNTIAKFGSRSATFAQSSQYLQTFFGNTINPTTSSITISFWARKPGAATGCGGGDDHIFGVSGPTANTRFYLRCATATNGWGMRFGGAAAANSAIAVQQGEWQHIVLVFDATNDQPKLYVNNVLRATSATVASFTIGDHFFLGNFNDRVNNTFLEGADANIDDFALYNRALSPSEITTLFEAGSAPLSPTVTATPYDNKAYLTWTTPSGVITDYVVEYKLSSEPTTWTTFSDGISTTTNTVVTGLVNGSSYDFRVSAKNDASTGTPSTTVTTTPLYRILFVSPTPTASSIINTSSFTGSASSTLPTASYLSSTHTLRLETSLGVLVGSQYSTTTRYGDYNLTHLTNSVSGLDMTIPANSSGAAYVSTTNTIFIPHNIGGLATTTISEVNTSGALVRSITCTACGDIESISLVSSVSDGSGGYNHTFLIGTEDYTSNARILRVVIPSSGASTVNATDFFQTGITHGGNLGLEGIAYNPSNGKVIAVTEQPLDIYEVTLGTAPAASSVEICANLSWNAAISDFTDLALVGNILYISSEDTNPSKIVAVDITNRSNCTFVDSDGDSDASGNDTGDWLSVGTDVGVTDQIEGLAWDTTGDTLYVIGEADFFGKYRTNVFTTQNTFTGLADGDYVLKSTFVGVDGVTANAADRSFTIDTTAPRVNNISSDHADGTFTTGEVIDIDVTFSEAVTSTGNVTVTLETGTTDRTCTFTVTSSTTGTCNYTVQAGDTTGDLTVNSISGTIADAAGNAMVNFTPVTNLAANKAIVISSADTTNPLISTLSPADNATGVAPSANLVLTFDEAVAVGSGNITIKKTSDDSTVEAIAVGSGLVTGGGTTTITINPTANLLDSTGYYVQVDATAFDDLAGNSYAGIASTTAWNFTTGDTTAPNTTVLTSPSLNANADTGIFTFSSDEGGSTFECRIDSGSYSSCTSPFVTSTLTAGLHTFYVRATDSSSNTDASPASYAWTIDLTNPTISTLSPADDATNVSPTDNLILTFDAAVVVGTGNVTLKKTSDDSTIQTFDVADTLSGLVLGTGTTTITINPTASLLDSTGYYVLVDATAFDDLAGNSYAGIASTTAWNFTTGVAGSGAPAAGGGGGGGTTGGTTSGTTTSVPPTNTTPTTPTTTTPTNTPTPPTTGIVQTLTGKKFVFPTEDPKIAEKLGLTTEIYQNTCVTNAGKPYYRKCVLGTSLNTTDLFRENVVCEGFIVKQETVDAYRYTDVGPRKEVVGIAVKMRRNQGEPVSFVTPNAYKKIYTDIGKGEASWIEPVVETALKYDIISSERTSFEGDRPITRSEAYAVITKAICIAPEKKGTEGWQESIYRLAFEYGLTSRTWSTFEPNTPILRQELFVLASKAADLAERTGGCNPKPEMCFGK